MPNSSKAKLNRQLVLSSISILLLSIAYGILRHHYLSHEIILDDGQKLDVRAISQAQIRDTQTNQLARLNDQKNIKYRLLIILTPADCFSCLASLSDWITLAKEHPSNSFAVDMIYVYTSKNEVAASLTYSKLPYFIYYDEKDQIAERLNESIKTPLTILVNSSFIPLAIEGPEQDKKSRGIFIKKVSSIIQ